KHTQADIDGTATGRTFRRDTAWCWDIQPRLGPAETIYHAVMVDGIWIGGWCLLIAFRDTGHVLAWQWSGGESTAAWTALLEQVPAPGILVSDGGSGLPTALRNLARNQTPTVPVSPANEHHPSPHPQPENRRRKGPTR